jgi:hypothetical protein
MGGRRSEMSDLPTDERLDAILRTAAWYAHLTSVAFADPKIFNDAREQFHLALDAWLEAKLAAMLREAARPRMEE